MDKRTDNWRSLLAAHIEANRLRPHAYGEHDCCLWAASAHEVVWGRDFARPYRGKYATLRGGLGLMLRRDGVRTPDELAAKRLGGRKNVAMAMAGDVVAADLRRLGAGEADHDLLALGVCFGASSYFVGDTGLVALPTLKLEHAYG